MEDAGDSHIDRLLFRLIAVVGWMVLVAGVVNLWQGHAFLDSRPDLLANWPVIIATLPVLGWVGSTSWREWRGSRAVRDYPA